MTIKPRILALLLALCAITPAAGAEITNRSVEIQGVDRTYTLYVPDAARAAVGPLVVVLHGSGGRAINMVKLWTQLADKKGFIVLGIDSFKIDGWRLEEDSPSVIHDFISAVRAEHPIDPRRIYLFGQSAGAVYALTLSMLESEYFAATAIHAGAWTKDPEFNLPRFATRKIPLKIFIGDRDEYFSLQSVHDTEGALYRQGIPVEVTIVRHHRHPYGEVSERIGPEIWTFFKNHPLDGDPKFTVY